MQASDDRINMKRAAERSAALSIQPLPGVNLS